MSQQTLRFLHRFARPAADPAREREVLLEVTGEPRSATVYLPDARPDTDRRPGSQPGWVLLQGITVPGRHHEGLRRMARALAAAGHVVLVPEVPSWTALRVDPEQAEPTVRGALAWLRTERGVAAEQTGLMGFSVAGTWVLEVAAGKVGEHLRSVVSLGGYGDFQRLLVAMVTGEHEWRGRRYRHLPDPYGRWIVGADLLPQVDEPGYGTREEREAAARALHRLASTAGRNGALANTPVYDSLIAGLRPSVPAGALPAWDLLAAPARQPVPDPAAGRALAGALAAAGVRAHPALEPAGRLDGLGRGRQTATLLHGRQDTLVPFTETLRLAAAFPERVRPRPTITRLVGHAKAAQLGRNPLVLARELARFAGAMHRVVHSLDR